MSSFNVTNEKVQHMQKKQEAFSFYCFTLVLHFEVSVLRCIFFFSTYSSESNIGQADVLLNDYVFIRYMYSKRGEINKWEES